MSDPDPIRRTAELVDHGHADALELRLKRDIFNSIGRIKPQMTEAVDFEQDVLNGTFFESLPPPLQGIAIARCEGTLAFYNRVGWHPSFLAEPLQSCVPADGLETLSTRYHAATLHDLAYIHPKHFERMLGKAGAASLWESLKRYVQDAPPPNTSLSAS